MDAWHASCDELKSLVGTVGPPAGLPGDVGSGFMGTARWITRGGGVRVLDAGCGRAELREQITRNGNAYVGIDVDGYAADYEASVTALPFHDGSFDLVLCRSVLQYVLEPLDALAEIHRVLSPGGRFLCSVAFLEPWAWGSLIHFTPAGITLLAQRSGLTVDNIWPGWSAEEAFNEAARQMTLLPEASLPTLTREAPLAFAGSVLLLCSKAGDTGQ